MIAFLLITAVWSQLATLKARQRGQGEGGVDNEPPTTRIVVVVHEDGFSLVVDTDQQALPKKGEGQGSVFDTGRLRSELEALKRRFPDKTDVQVASEDAIKFEVLIETMDAVMTAGFPDVSLLDAGAGAL